MLFVGNVQKTEKVVANVWNYCLYFFQNFRSHMSSVSHQQRMMEIQHMSNACLVTLLPRAQESLQEANKDGSV